MANNKSAKKRIEIAKRNRLQNLYYKTSVRSLTKLFFKTLKQTPESKEKLQTILNSIYSYLDKGTKKRFFIKIQQLERKQDLLMSFQQIAKL
uniref:30S ribosomal protein S20 n=1 Tax=Pseudo-nitzschia multiseries TaxID=37319 RepID=A0A0K1DC23_PSEMU|nr:30S ribosomal protein S20 [Pseudo-nitzschia multiseries]AKT26110.1 30S ribosomal protein S20 [Pseudo-nitzschia multiseries]